MKYKLFIIDVDGTMTDGGIYYGENREEWKKFCTKDAAGFFAVHESGAKTMVLTGRKCQATQRRMTELKADYVFQGITDKEEFVRQFLADRQIGWEQAVYIGDDLNDLLLMEKCGYAGCPADSCKEVKAAAGYVSSVKGGHGAVRDIVEHIFEEEGNWEEIVRKIYMCGR